MENSAHSYTEGSEVDNTVELKKQIVAALIEKRFYNPHDVFQHEPEFHKSKDVRYIWEVWIVKWNTRSTRVTMLLVRFDEKKGWVFSKKQGQPRIPHGEKMR